MDSLLCQPEITQQMGRQFLRVQARQAAPEEARQASQQPPAPGWRCGSAIIEWDVFCN
jgi:hypothetical protein